MIRAHLPDAYDKIHHVTEYLPRGSTRAQGERRLDELNDGARRGTARIVTPEALGVYLERWLTTTIAPRAKPKTVDNYRFAISHLQPLAHLDLRHVTEEHILQLQVDLQRTLAQSSTVFILTVLKAALKAAVIKKLLYEHPMAGITIGTPQSEEVTPLTPAEARAMVSALDGPPAADRAGAGRVPGLALGRDPRPDVGRRRPGPRRSVRALDAVCRTPDPLCARGPEDQTQPALDSRCRTSCCGRSGNARSSRATTGCVTAPAIRTRSTWW